MRIMAHLVKLVTLATIWVCVCCDNHNQTNDNISRHHELEQGSVPLTRCCSLGQFYRIGLDVCREWPGFQQETPRFPPVYYSAAYNETETITANDPTSFELKENLASCPEGTVAQSSSTFKFYRDGSLSVQYGKPAQHRFLVDSEFCIGQITQDDPSGQDFVARFCVPDPCRESNCIRKCCPEGAAINDTIKMCQSSAIPFNVTLRDENDVVVDASLIVRDGVSPQCSHDIQLYYPDMHPEDYFYILPDGRMYVPINRPAERFVTQYCIENFFDDDSFRLRALACFPPPNEDTGEDKLVMSLFPYFFFSSTVFLVATFLVYALIPEIRNIHGVTIMCYVAAMAITYIGLGIIQTNRDVHNVLLCQGLAIVTHFSFLASFSWLNVVSFDIWWTFRSIRPTKSPHNRHRLGLPFFWYSLYAWGVPFVIVLVGQVLDRVQQIPNTVIKPRFGGDKCWFSSRSAYLVYLYGPASVLIFSNIIFFVMTAVFLYRASIDTALVAGNLQAKQRFRIIFSLFLLMGVTWLAEVVTFGVEGSEKVSLFTDIVNILTGVYVFVIFVCKKKVWKLLKLKFPCLERLESGCLKIRRRIFPKRSPNPAVSRTTSDSTTYNRRSTLTSVESNLIINTHV